MVVNAACASDWSRLGKTVNQLNSDENLYSFKISFSFWSECKKLSLQTLREWQLRRSFKENAFCEIQNLLAQWFPHFPIVDTCMMAIILSRWPRNHWFVNFLDKPGVMKKFWLQIRNQRTEIILKVQWVSWPTPKCCWPLLSCTTRAVIRGPLVLRMRTPGWEPLFSKTGLNSGLKNNKILIRMPK